MEQKSFERGTLDEDSNTVYYISFFTYPSLYDQFYPDVQSMVDSFNLDTSGIAQDEAQPSFDLGDDFTDSGDGMRDFQMFMDSFANSIFNGSSIFSGIGTSMVNGIKVSGINTQDSNNDTNARVTVSLSADSSTAINNNMGSVTVIAMRIPFNIQNLISLGTLSSSEQDTNLFDGSTGINPFEGAIMPPYLGDGGEEGAGNISQSVNPFDFLSDLQIGSTSLVNPDWSTPQSVTMGLNGTVKGSNNNNNGNQTDTLDLILVSVIPFTGEERD
jgi:hypothetical protein